MSAPYRPPTFTTPIDLDLSRNEGRPRISQVEIGLEEGASLTSRYPDTSELRATIAERHGVTPGQVLVTAGGDDALFRCFLAASGGTVVSTTPTFEMIRRYAEQTTSTLVEIPWWDGDFPVSDLLATSERYMAVIVSPNNPTGSVIGPGDLRKMADAYLLVVLDAAYAEFADEDLTPAALELGNVIVVRTLSKAYGMAGLRVGYALGPEDMIARIGAFGSPYPVSSVSSALACEVLTAGEKANRPFVQAVIEQRGRLTMLLDALGCAPLPSQANFVLATDVDPDWLVAAAASLGVGLRHFPDREDLRRCVRITVPGDDRAFERLESVLRSALAPEAILLDLDRASLDPGLLARLEARVPLGFVTGSGPEAVSLTMSGRGVDHAWMLGSTPSSLLSARSAGVVPIGVRAPEENAGALSPAARVLGAVNELGEVLDVAKI
jgi:histidinol-phosphate aminotransferase